MAKAYWIAHFDVENPAMFEKYRQANGAAFEKYGAKFLIRGGDQTICEGAQRPRSVVIEFADLETAKACYDSPEYAAAKAIRLPAADADLIIVEGYEA